MAEYLADVDVGVLARYPFRPEAARFVADQGPSIEDLATSRIYSGTRSASVQRLIAAINDSTIPINAIASDFAWSESSSVSGRPIRAVARIPFREAFEDLLSYVYARVIASAIGDKFLIRRHALAEALRVKELVLLEDSPVTVAETGQALGLGFVARGRDVAVHFTEYIQLSQPFHDASWKLTTQRVRSGYVELKRERSARLIQEALRVRIESELPRPISKEHAAAVISDANEVTHVLEGKKATLPTMSFGATELGNIPPCMAVILSQLQRGENAAHNARFAIVTFLSKIGMSSEQIIALFAQAPDFKEEVTRYQVEHITGKSSGTTYSVPGCDNLQTFNLCYADDVCRSRTKAGVQRVKYPGDYYRYMQEAKPLVELLTARMPVEGSDGLVRALAENYGMLKTVEEIVHSPRFAAINAQPGAKPLVFDAADKWAIPRFAATLVGLPPRGARPA